MTYTEIYKKYRNKLTSVLRRAKNSYYKKPFVNNAGNPEQQWKTLNSILGNNSGFNNRAIKVQIAQIFLKNSIISS